MSYSPQVSQVGPVPAVNPVDPVFIEAPQTAHAMTPTAQPILPTTVHLLSTLPLPQLHQTSTHGVLVFDSITLPGSSSIHPISIPTIADVSAGSLSGSVSVSISASASEIASALASVVLSVSSGGISSGIITGTSESGVGIGAGIMTVQLASPTQSLLITANPAASLPEQTQQVQNLPPASEDPIVSPSLGSNQGASASASASAGGVQGTMVGIDRDSAASLVQPGNIFNTTNRLFPLGVTVIIIGGLLCIAFAFVLFLKFTGCTKAKRRLGRRSSVPSFAPDRGISRGSGLPKIERGFGFDPSQPMTRIVPGSGNGNGNGASDFCSETDRYPRGLAGTAPQLSGQQYDQNVYANLTRGNGHPGDPFTDAYSIERGESGPYNVNNQFQGSAHANANDAVFFPSPPNARSSPLQQQLQQDSPYPMQMPINQGRVLRITNSTPSPMPYGSTRTGAEYFSQIPQIPLANSELAYNRSSLNDRPDFTQTQSSKASQDRHTSYRSSMSTYSSAIASSAAHSPFLDRFDFQPAFVSPVQSTNSPPSFGSSMALAAALARGVNDGTQTTRANQSQGYRAGSSEITTFSDSDSLHSGSNHSNHSNLVPPSTNRFTARPFSGMSSTSSLSAYSVVTRIVPPSATARLATLPTPGQAISGASAQIASLGLALAPPSRPWMGRVDSRMSADVPRDVHSLRSSAASVPVDAGAGAGAGAVATRGHGRRLSGNSANVRCPEEAKRLDMERYGRVVELVPRV